MDKVVVNAFTIVELRCILFQSDGVVTFVFVTIKEADRTVAP